MNVERNVVYGMYSGLALLMDVYRPDQPNGYGIVHISGSGWSAPLGLDARPLKASAHVETEALPLVEAGYTVCSINHRATPRFPYPAAVETVPIAQSEAMFAAIQGAGVPAKLTRVPGGVHGPGLVRDPAVAAEI